MIGEMSDAPSGLQSNATNFEQPFTDAYLAQHTFDDIRVGKLQEAIMKAVKPGDVVADLGSGQGLLALFAAQAGAAKVYCVEIDESHTKYITWLARKNGAADKIIAINGDARKIDLPEPVDVMLCEIISAGLFYEPQLQVMNHNLSRLKPGGLVVPEMMENAVQLIHAQDSLYGLKLPPVTRWTDLEDDQILTTTATYHRADFYKHNDTYIDASVELTAVTDGVTNAIRVLPDIWSRLPRPGEAGIRQNTPSPSFGNPQIVWLKEPVTLTKGKVYDVRLQYNASDHPDMSTLTVRPAAK